LHVVDAVGARDHALERSREEPAHQVRVRTDVRRRDAHHRDVAARILADAERADRLQACDQDHQIDDDRENRALDEEAPGPHQLFPGAGAGSLPGWTRVSTRTAEPLCSLNTPEVTTSSPDSTPDSTAI